VGVEPAPALPLVGQRREAGQPLEGLGEPLDLAIRETQPLADRARTGAADIEHGGEPAQPVGRLALGRQLGQRRQAVELARLGQEMREDVLARHQSQHLGRGRRAQQLERLVAHPFGRERRQEMGERAAGG
jgi:hypothetical protein